MTATHLPELLVLAVDVDPELLHEREGVARTLVGQEAGNVGVRARRIAALGEGPIAAAQGCQSPSHLNTQCRMN